MLDLKLGLGLSTPQSFAPPVITTATPLTAGTEDQAYSVQLAGTGAITGWTLTSGTLPTGITLSAAGLLSGTPTNSGTFSNLVIRASGPGGYNEKTFSVDIAAAGMPTANLTALYFGQDDAVGYSKRGQTSRCQSATGRRASCTSN
jgi:hypothetical protein